jgi:hypothetical protein
MSDCDHRAAGQPGFSRSTLGGRDLPAQRQSRRSALQSLHRPAQSSAARLSAATDADYAQSGDAAVAVHGAHRACDAAAVSGLVGLIAAALVLHLAFVLDCVDGQLARIKGLSSPVGAYLDFLVDELKAVLLIACCAGRLALDGRAPLLALHTSPAGVLAGPGTAGGVHCFGRHLDHDVYAPA